ncbi:hypothetical protein EVA_14953 [gut metagenome]|uniref:Uncharacterized protein n=1 Tax=gut metagenome TaxID=749906 RepID=J9FPR0_9ZZZZ
MAYRLESGEVVHHKATEECASIFQGRLIYHNLRSFCLNTLHYPLDR